MGTEEKILNKSDKEKFDKVMTNWLSFIDKQIGPDKEQAWTNYLQSKNGTRVVFNFLWWASYFYSLLSFPQLIIFASV